MNVTPYLAAVNFGLAAFDAWLTRRRMKDYGVNVELNRTIRFAAEHLGVEFGPVVAITGIAALQSYLCTYFGLDWVLGILIGIRGKLFMIQLASLRFEKQAKEIRARLKKAWDESQKNSEDSSATLPDAAHSAPSQSSDAIKDSDENS